MPHFAEFFSDGAGFGVEMAQALDAGQAFEKEIRGDSAHPQEGFGHI